jgi:predicted transcriptional regulator
MKTKQLTEALERVETWPAQAQDELARVALEMEAEIKGVYHASAEELAGIDRGLRAADAGVFASDNEVEAAFAKLRQT